MAGVAETAELVADAMRLGLSGASFVASLPPEQVAADFNGIGPAWFPDWLRKGLDSLFSPFRPPAMIHDNRWAHADGSRRMFDASNDELRRNCETVAMDYSWYNPLRYYFLAKGRQAAKFCSLFGWSAYRDACRGVRCAGREKLPAAGAAEAGAEAGPWTSAPDA